MEYSITGRWNSEATSRIIWMLSASSSRKWPNGDIGVGEECSSTVANKQCRQCLLSTGNLREREGAIIQTFFDPESLVFLKVTSAERSAQEDGYA